MRHFIRRVWVAGGLALTLAACGGSKTVTAENASTAEVAAKVQQSGITDQGFVSPGRWQMTMTITDMKIPGMPPEVAQKMKGATGQARTFEHCVTEEEAKKPREDFFSGDKAAACRYDHFTMGDGKVSMQMQCAHDTGKQTVKMDGTYSADSYRMTMASKVEGRPGSPVGGMTFDAVMDARRLGVCTGKEPN